jgi:hypothetical protein
LRLLVFAFLLLSPLWGKKVVTPYLTVKESLKKIDIEKYKPSEENIPVGVMLWEFKDECPDMSVGVVEESRITVHDTDLTDQHATEVAYLLQESSPYSHIHCMRYNRDIDPEKYTPKIYASNHSYRLYRSNTGDLDDGKYNSYDQYLDNYVKRHKLAMFVATGNLDYKTQTKGRKFVTSPGKAFNVITVGNFTKKESGVPNSVSGNPSTGAEKPEFLSQGSFKFPKYGRRFGASYATPFVTSAFGVNLLSKYKSFRYQPQLLKAYLLTLGSYPVDKNGAGELKWRDDYTYKVWWNSETERLFRDKLYIEKRKYLYAGKKYRLAISWLVDGDYVLKHQKINLDLDLHIRFGESILKSGNRRRDNFELVEFSPKRDGFYTFEIKKYFFDKRSDGELYLGMVLREIN